MIHNLITRFISNLIATVAPEAAIRYECSRAAYKSFTNKRSLTGGYDAAKKTGPNQAWNPASRSGTYENLTSLARVKARARDLSRNNPYVKGGKRKILANTIGPDLLPVFSIKDDNGKPDRALNEELNQRVRNWADSAMLDGKSFHISCELVEDTLFTDGEVLCNKVVLPRGKAKGQNPFKIQILETDYLNTSSGIYGVEYDDFKRPVKYHVFKDFPDTSWLYTTGAMTGGESVEISADNIFLIYNSDRPSSYRGISELAPVVMGLYTVDQLEAAELDAIRSASAFGLVVSSQYSQEVLEKMRWSNTDSDKAGDEDAERQQYVEAGQILYLQPQESVTAFKNERPNSNLIPFIDKQVTSASSALGMANEELSNDYSKVNYSSARQSSLVAKKIYQTRRARLRRQYLDKVINEWLFFEVMTQNIPGLSPEKYMQNMSRYQAKRYSFPAFEWVDPKKEIDAIEKEISLCLTSRQEVLAEKNRDFYNISADLAEEKEVMQELDIWEVDPTVQKTKFEAEMPEENNNDEERAEENWIVL